VTGHVAFETGVGVGVGIEVGVGVGVRVGVGVEVGGARFTKIANAQSPEEDASVISTRLVEAI